LGQTIRPCGFGLGASGFGLGVPGFGVGPGGFHACFGAFGCAGVEYGPALLGVEDFKIGGERMVHIYNNNYFLLY
jgi:hypothetical protein